MNDAPSKRQVLTARAAWFLILVLSVAGLIGYFSSPVEQRSLIQDIIARPSGPMAFRFILQPIMATLAAYRDGVRDARRGRSPYFATILLLRGQRTARLYEGLIATSQIILLGLIVDTIYQIIVLKTFFPGQAVIVALVLAFVPYLALRGPIARIARLRTGVSDKKVER